MVIADTGFWLALANRKDNFHERAKSVLSELQEPLITTWPIVTETCHLLLNRMGSFAQVRFIKGLVTQSFHVFDIPESSHSRIIKLMERYQDLPMDFADASLVILAEHLGDGRIVSTDQRDFKTYKWKQNKPFANLLC